MEAPQNVQQKLTSRRIKIFLKKQGSGSKIRKCVLNSILTRWWLPLTRVESFIQSLSWLSSMKTKGTEGLEHSCFSINRDSRHLCLHSKKEWLDTDGKQFLSTGEKAVQFLVSSVFLSTKLLVYLHFIIILIRSSVFLLDWIIFPSAYLVKKA